MIARAKLAGPHFGHSGATQNAMQRKGQSECSELEGQIASLEAELVAIAFWDHHYLESQHHSLIDQVAFQGRQLRAKEIISELKMLKRLRPPQARSHVQSPPPEAITDQPVLNRKNLTLLSDARWEGYRLRRPKLRRT